MEDHRAIYAPFDSIDYSINLHVEFGDQVGGEAVVTTVIKSVTSPLPHYNAYLHITPGNIVDGKTHASLAMVLCCC